MILTNATKSMYMKRISDICYIDGNEILDMNVEKIKYIAIEHDYERKNMPIIYMSISLESTLYTKVLKNKNTAKIYLRIQTYNTYSNAPLYKDYINDQFTYFLSALTPNYSDALSESNANDDSNYRTMTIGLMSMTLMNTLRKTFCGIKKNIDQHTLIYNAVEDTKIIMKTPAYNEKYDTFIIPALSSRQQMLNYIFEEDPFYDTEFMYFIDYDYSYLLDKTGEVISSIDGTYDTVIMDIESMTDDESYNEGMYVYANSYFFYVVPGDVNISLDLASEKVANQLVAVTDEGTDIIDLDINNTEDSSTKQIFERYHHKNYLPFVFKNKVEASQVRLNVIKEGVDTSLLTPNKKYLVKNYQNHSEYNGTYMLLSKREVITGSAGAYISRITMTLKKTNNYQEADTDLSTTSVSTTKVTSTSSTVNNTYSTKTTSTSATKNTTTTSTNS